MNSGQRFDQFRIQERHLILAYRNRGRFSFRRQKYPNRILETYTDYRITMRRLYYKNSLVLDEDADVIHKDRAE